MQKKLLLSFGLCLALAPLHASDGEATIDLDSDQGIDLLSSDDETSSHSSNDSYRSAGGYVEEEEPLGFLGDVSSYFDKRKPKVSNSSLSRWGGTFLVAIGNPYARWFGNKLSCADEFRSLANTPGLPREAKGVIAFLLLYLDTPSTEGATGLQKGAERLLSQLQQHNVFVQSDRGKLRFDLQQFKSLRADPDFQATTNALLYASTGELGVSLLGTLGERAGGIWSLLGCAEELGFAKDLLLPLIIFRSRYGRSLPGTIAYLRENTLRYAGKRVLSFIAGQDEKFAKDFFGFSAEVLCRLGVVSSKTEKHVKDKDVKLQKLFDEWLIQFRGKLSKQSASIMGSAQDCFVNLGDATYPRSFFAHMRGALDIIEINKSRNTPINAFMRKLGVPVSDNGLFLAEQGTPLYKRQLEGYVCDMREEIAQLQGEKEKNAKLLQAKRSPLLGLLVK